LTSVSYTDDPIKLSGHSIATMSDDRELLCLPKQPLQQRAKDRFEKVLAEAQVLLLSEGMSGFSIPALADRLGFLRGTIYNLFPTPNALLNELALRYLNQLEDALVKEASRANPTSWQAVVESTCAVTARFYNEFPVARMLLLGGPVTHDSYRAFEMSVQRLGGLARQLFLLHGVKLPVAPPDVAYLAVEMGSSCLRVSVMMHDAITPEYEKEIARAMIAYLSLYAPV